jgi:hypothetical protein
MSVRVARLHFQRTRVRVQSLVEPPLSLVHHSNRGVCLVESGVEP